VHGHHSEACHVAQQHLGDSERERQECGDLGDRTNLLAQLGDGSVFDRPGAGRSDPVEAVESDPDRMRDGYRRSIEYSLSTLVSYVEKHGDDDLVLVVLGDHQPAAFVAGDEAGMDVPITIVTRDRAVLDRVAAWGWQDGLRPGPRAPIWPMESFRDRFLTAFAQ